MKLREFFRTLRDCFLFLLIMAGILLGLGLANVLVGAASFRHVWTWVLPITGLAIFDGIIRFTYKKKSQKKSSD